MQRAEMEEVRQREANETALLAIGPRKKPKLNGPSIDTPSATLYNSSSSQNFSSGLRNYTSKQVCFRSTLIDCASLIITAILSAYRSEE